MKIFKKLHDHFFKKEKKPEIAQINVSNAPAIPNPEPSCVAKGIVKLWLEEDGWTVTRKKTTVEYYGSGGFGNHQYYAVELKYPKLGIKIEVSEYMTRPDISMGAVRINDEIVIYIGHYNNPDSDAVKAAILSKPYPALKKRLDKKKKYDETRQTRIDAVKSIGCPKE